MSTFYTSKLNSNLKTLTVKRKNYRTRLQSRCSNLDRALNKSLFKTLLFIYVPPLWQLTIIRSSLSPSFALLYLSSGTYFFYIPLPLRHLSIRFDKQTSALVMLFLFTNNYIKLGLNLVQKLLHSFTRLFFLKLKFKGKGYYIFKNSRNTITPQFGHAHRIYCYAYYVSVKFLTKTTILLYGLSNRDTLTVGGEVKRMRPINVFTGRGVRFARQVVYKKTGKVSSYR